MRDSQSCDTGSNPVGPTKGIIKMNIKSLLSGVLLTIAVVTLLLVLSGCAKKDDLTNQEWSSISEYISKNGPLKQEDIQVD